MGSSCTPDRRNSAKGDSSVRLSVPVRAISRTALPWDGCVHETGPEGCCAVLHGRCLCWCGRNSHFWICGLNSICEYAAHVLLRGLLGYSERAYTPVINRWHVLEEVQRLLLDCLHLWLLDRMHLRLTIVCTGAAIVETKLLPLLNADLW